MSRRTVVIRRLAVLAVGAALLSSRFAVTALAAPVSPPAPVLVACDPCVTVIDTPAWNEAISVLEQAQGG